MTFSLVARCSVTDMFGVAISSSSPAVAARCSYARAGTGAVATQNVTDPTLGPRVLDLLARGLSSKIALGEISRRTKFMEYRQVLAVDGQGLVTIFSGREALGVSAEASSTNVGSAGNLLAHEEVPKIIVEAFLAAKGHLGDRLLTALRAGLSAGGEAGPVHSAGMKIVDKVSWPIADLRCDWTNECPIETVANAWEVYKPQMRDYVQRALDPSAAPSYGVPGDE